MGLAKALVPPALASVYRTARWLVTELKPPEVLLDGEFVLVDEGPDDLWPGEEHSLLGQSIVSAEPQLVVTQQWGLRCPGGEVHWNDWQGITFDHPLHRVQMIATLQQTALDMGFAEDQVPAFLDYYGWVTRNQIAQVVYEDTGAYSLTDSAVSALGTPENGESPDDGQIRILTNESHDDADATEADPSGDLCRRSVGGDEE